VTHDAPAPPPVASLQQRIAAWDRIVTEAEAGYALDLDDWLNDMDLRRAIEEAAASLPADGRRMLRPLAAADRRFRRATVAAGKCLWGSAVAAREGWHPDRQWWYFRRPRRGNPALDQEIESVA
jgi:hypothetical protein